MKRLSSIILLCTILFATSCKKAIEKIVEQKQEDLVVQAMTSGVWEMAWFKENNIDILDFNGYQFKYFSNYTVDATAASGIVTQGTWSGNASAMTTSSNFANTAPGALLKINGTWRITRNSWTFVEAEQINGTVTKTMRLVKK